MEDPDNQRIIARPPPPLSMAPLIVWLIVAMFVASVVAWLAG